MKRFAKIDIPGSEYPSEVNYNISQNYIKRDQQFPIISLEIIQKLQGH